MSLGAKDSDDADVCVAPRRAKGEGARPFTKSAKANPNFRDRPTTGMRTSLVSSCFDCCPGSRA